MKKTTLRHIVIKISKGRETKYIKHQEVRKYSSIKKMACNYNIFPMWNNKKKITTLKI